MPLARRGSRRIHWELAGSGPAVVLLPGTGAGARQFGTLPRRFARAGLSCLVTSPVGIAPSSPLDGPFSLEEAAHDVLAVTAAAGLGRAVPVGVSLGGKLALAAHDLAPDRLPRLVMLGSAVVANPRARRILRLFEIAARELGADDLGEVLAPLLFGRSFQVRRPELVADIVRGMRPDDAARRLMVSQARALATFDAEALARRTRCPVLCVAGGEDVLTPAADVRATAELLPDGRYLEIAGAGHSLLLESGAVFDALVAFARQP